MDRVKILQMPAFKRAYKKLHLNQQIKVDEAIEEIRKNPKIGEEKKGDLSRVYVYKFKVHRQEMLLAYEWEEQTRTLMVLGVHENFYRDLKR